MNDPLAYFITWTCKGSRLHGDSRGSVDRDNNQYGEPFLEPDDVRFRSVTGRLGEGGIVLNNRQRDIIERTLHEVATFRGWSIVACSARTNHIHVVVHASDYSPERIMNDFKSWSTRRLREAKLLPSDTAPWSRHGSTRYLWKENDVADAVTYVTDCQDDRGP